MTRPIALLALLLCGCAAPGPTYEQAARSELIKANHAAADRLHEQGKHALDASKPMLTATLVNIDDLSQSSRLGRLISEQFASRFAQNGMTVVEMKMRGDIFVQKSVGELLLSREVREISASHEAQAVMVGTYAIAQDYVYVSVKLVRSVDSEILAAHDFALPLDGNVLGLLPSRR